MPNHGLLEITKLEDAQEAWKIFFDRFYSAEVPEQVNIEFDANQSEFSPREDKEAKTKRFSWDWDKEAGKPYYSNEDGRTSHSDAFDDFLNGNTVTIPSQLNKIDLERLEEAVNEGNYQDDIFNDKNYVYYALWLFRQNKITRQQLSTLLARAQFSEKYPIVKTFQILNEQGEFTEDAKQMLIPILKNNAFNKFDDQHLQRFRLLIQAAPKSEQIFYITECDPNSVAVEGPLQLGNALLLLNAWKRITYQNRLYDLQLSFGAMEARQIGLKGVHGAAANLTKLGKISNGAMNEGVINNYRLTAINIDGSGVDSTTKEIHQFPVKVMPAITQNDIFHAQLHNTIPAEFHMAISHMKEIISNFTQLETSSLQTVLTDREFYNLRKKNIELDDPKKGAKYFIDMLTHADKLHSGSPPFFFNDYTYSRLNEDGIALIRDMVMESDKWLKLYKIDINSLNFPYGYAIQKMHAFLEEEAFAENEVFNAKLFSLKYRIFCELPRKTYRKENKLIDSFCKALVNELSFENEEAFNKTVLKYNDVVLTDDRSVLKAIILRNYLNTNFTPDKEKIHSEFMRLEPEFESIHAGSQFTQAKLDNACNNLDSVVDKLMLLELCYTKILKTNYARRDTSIDNTMAIFSPGVKNPLTLSQRKHIGLLKTKMSNLISGYLLETVDLSKTTDVQEARQFGWAIENYFTLMHYNEGVSNKTVKINSELKEIILKKYLNTKFTLDNEKTHCELTQLEPEFKSIHAGSQFTQAKLDSACNNLDSVVDKLMLLELCYTKILKTNYARRHTLIDNAMATFFPGVKNPLTLSQRKHIALLKTKMRDLVKEHLSKTTNALVKEQFAWAIENYFTLMHHKDWSFKLGNDLILDNSLNVSRIPRNL